jgi:hypothetical protein
MTRNEAKKFVSVVFTQVLWRYINEIHLTKFGLFVISNAVASVILFSLISFFSQTLPDRRNG